MLMFKKNKSCYKYQKVKLVFFVLFIKFFSMKTIYNFLFKILQLKIFSCLEISNIDILTKILINY